jgi:hypothetical protein
LLVGTQTAAYTESVPAKSYERIITQSPTPDTRKKHSLIASGAGSGTRIRLVHRRRRVGDERFMLTYLTYLMWRASKDLRSRPSSRIAA